MPNRCSLNVGLLKVQRLRPSRDHSPGLLMPRPMIRIATWNPKWATPALWRGEVFRDAIVGLAADIVCVTRGPIPE